MKNFFKKFKTYGFWVSLSSALVILLTSLGKAFGFTVEKQIIEDCVMSLAGLLVVLGIVSMNKSDKNIESDRKDKLDENNEENGNKNNDE